MGVFTGVGLRVQTLSPDGFFSAEILNCRKIGSKSPNSKQNLPNRSFKIFPRCASDCKSPLGLCKQENPIKTEFIL